MTNDSKGHNGWTNYATWRVQLEIFDGMDLGEFFAAGYDEPILKDERALAEWMRGYARDLIEDSSTGLARDYALAFLSDVDWCELARHEADMIEHDDN